MTEFICLLTLALWKNNRYKKTLINKFIRTEINNTVLSILVECNNDIRQYLPLKYVYQFSLYTTDGTKEVVNEDICFYNVYKLYGLSNIKFSHMKDLIGVQYKLFQIHIRLGDQTELLKLPENHEFQILFKKKWAKRKKYKRPKTYVCKCGIEELAWQKYKRCSKCHDNDQRYCSYVCYIKFHTC